VKSFHMTMGLVLMKIIKIILAGAALKTVAVISLERDQDGE